MCFAAAGAAGPFDLGSATSITVRFGMKRGKHIHFEANVVNEICVIGGQKC